MSLSKSCPQRTGVTLAIPVRLCSCRECLHLGRGLFAALVGSGLAELELLDLPGRGLRQVAEDDASRRLEPGDALLDVLDELRLRGGCTRSQLNVGDDRLAPVGIRRADNGR